MRCETCRFWWGSGHREGGNRDVLGVGEGLKEDKEGWRGFLRYLKKRGWKGVSLVISDASMGLLESVGEVYPEAKWQR
jgi:putative transposase